MATSFLGKIVNEFAKDSIFNEYNKYGSKFGAASIFNEFGRFGGKFSQLRFRIGRARIVFGQIREHFYEHVFGISAAEAQKLYDKYLQSHRNVVGFEPS